MQDDGDGQVGSKGDVVDGGGHDEKGDDPPGVSHAGDFDGEVHFDGEVRVGFQGISG